MVQLHLSFLGQWKYTVLQCLENRMVLTTRIGFDVLALLQYANQDAKEDGFSQGLESD